MVWEGEGRDTLATLILTPLWATPKLVGVLSVFRVQANPGWNSFIFGKSGLPRQAVRYYRSL